ncbi:MAG TPA: shikimate kinase [Chthoniobacterales bacterium]
MGSGKSSVGRELARQTGLPFEDTDLLIRGRVGQSISEIFAAHGEAFFRAQERAALRELQTRQRFVLATGGGIVLDPANRTTLRSLGPVVCLTAEEETIWARVSRNRHRPLLDTPNPRQTLRELLTTRSPLYEEVADFTVDSTGLSHGEVARQILTVVQGWSGRSDDR